MNKPDGKEHDAQWSAPLLIKLTRADQPDHQNKVTINSALLEMHAQVGKLTE